jgi:predicted dehydrogenase
MRNLLALGERDLVFFRSRRGTLPEDEIAGYPVETDLQAALAHRPQAVVISNPTALHLDVAIPAAEAGCHLLLEKPVSHSLERLDMLQAALLRGGGKALVGFQLRFHPTLRQAAGLLEDGAIGRPLSARAHWGEYLPNWHPWEDYRQSYAARADLGGGVVLTLTHPLDYLRWLLGEARVEWAAGSSLGLGLDVEDTAEIGLRFENGALGTVHLDYLQQPPTHTLEIIGTQGTLRWDNASAVLALFRAGQADWQTFAAPDGFERNMLFIEETKHFLAVARGETEPLCSLHDGIRALELALAARTAITASLTTVGGASREVRS